MTSPSVEFHTAGEPIPAELRGVRWSDGLVECRFRLLHPGGSLVAEAGDVGEVVSDRDVECTTCSDACAL